MDNRGRTVLAMDCVLAGSELRHDRPLNRIVMRLWFHRSSKPGTVTVAGKPSVDIPPGTPNIALKQAGLKK